MSTPETLVQATLNRLLARVGSGVADAAAAVAVIAQDAPERLRQEWDLFREEVQLEAERLEAEATAPAPAADQTPSDPAGSGGSAPAQADPVAEDGRSAQQRIDALRSRVSDLSARLEDPA
ncbi:hypothetical protein EVJ50_11685 [Synechococcus sp. RSCCF101]|uniref:hypothetical protein n=1 Tax=Synechococcus sp. RSCCF101 TaxID=2511069 RepID=UPI0012490184|nr:hypothetical protein [Synechococcus sp. RSCCF101]QEY32793.1 hypothetical protein EVJ50_11685 [Synechococcus sp. RSCCF101]